MEKIFYYRNGNRLSKTNGYIISKQTKPKTRMSLTVVKVKDVV